MIKFLKQTFLIIVNFYNKQLNYINYKFNLMNMIDLVQ